jgi:hypothetical protein
MTTRMTNRQNPSDDPVGEAAGSFGLLLNVAALMLFVVSLASVGTGQIAVAGSLAIASVVGFFGSLVCFAMDGRRAEQRVTRE